MTDLGPNTPKPNIKTVEAFGATEARSDSVGDSIITGEFTGGLAVTFDNGYQVYVGSQDGYGPMKVWLVGPNGENAEGGHMSWSEQFEFEVPQR